MLKTSDIIKGSWFIIGFLGIFYWLPYIPPSFFLILKQIIIFILLIISILIVKPRKIQYNFILKYLSIYAIVASIISMIHFDSGLQFKTVSRILGPLLITWIYLSVSKQFSVKEYFFKGFIVSIVVNIIYILWTYKTKTNLAPQEIVGGWAGNHPADFGFTNSHTGLSPMIGIAILTVLFGNKIITHKAFKFILIPFLTAGILLTTGEGGIIATLSSILFIFLFKIVKNQFLRRIAIITFLSVAFFFMLSPLNYIVDSQSLSSTYYEHLASYLVGIKIFLSNPIVGVGLDNVVQASIIFYNTSNFAFNILSSSLQPHNPLIQTLAEGGIFLGLIFILLWRKILIIVTRKKTLLTTHNKWIISIIILYLIIGIFEPWPLISNIFYNIPLYILLVELVELEKISR